MDKVYISENANSILINYLISVGLDVEFITPPPHISTGIAAHPDIYMCKLGVTDDSPVFFGSPDSISEKYPGDIIYNAVCSGKYFIHKLSETSPDLLKAAKDMGMKVINTRQGYSKCSTAVIDENSFITSDKAIALPLEAEEADVLLIEKGYIKLRGYDTGFIGGTCGRIGDTVVFNGNLATHPDFESIKNFIECRGLSVKYFEEYQLEDIGSIIYCQRKWS